MVQAGDFCFRMSGFLLAVDGPVQFFRSRNGDGVGTEESDHFAVVGFLLKGADTFAKLKQVLWRLYPYQLHHTAKPKKHPWTYRLCFKWHPGALPDPLPFIAVRAFRW